ncbi:MAG: ThuA domain-containing protein [Bryobacterales bacterium]|nr:ThuA domain-containing protein [Bryobacterales bacterium]
MMRLNVMMRAAVAAMVVTCAVAADPWLTFAGGKGPGKGKHIVLVSGDEEYRSEEAMPQLGRILAERHGFKTTVLFAMDPDGRVNPENRKNIPGLEALRTADLMIVATRYRQLPDEQMKLWDEYVHSGKPMMGLRTATHAFAFDKDVQTSYRQWDNRDKGEWPGGFGKQVLGETWISHHGKHKVQSTRGVIAPGAEKHPVLRGVKDVWGPTDVYTVRLLPEGTTTLLLGQVLAGMNATDPPAEGKWNDPMMPLAWVRTFTTRTGKQARVFTTTMGASVDLVNEDLRRLVVNAAYWAVGLEKKIPKRADVGIVGVYEPTFYGFGKHRRGLRPEEYAK